MKQEKLFFLLGCLFIFYGCAPVYKCGDPIPPQGIQGSNRLLDVVQERDQLCKTVKIKKKENAYFVKKNQELELRNDSLTNEYKELKGEYAELQENYGELKDKNQQLLHEKLAIGERYSQSMTNSLKQGHLYDQRLNEKRERLEQERVRLKKREAKIQKLEDQLHNKDSILEHLQFLIKRALIGFDSDVLTTKIKDGKVYVLMSDELMFQSGKAKVQSKGKEALLSLATVLQGNKMFNILVRGHTDNIPIHTDKFKDNWELSLARSLSIIHILQEDYKINPQRLIASGRSQYDPRASNKTASGRAKNRRTAIILIPTILTENRN